MAAISDMGDTSRTREHPMGLMAEEGCVFAGKEAVAFGNKSTFVTQMMKTSVGAQ